MKIYFACFSDIKFLHFRKKLCRKAKAIFDGVFEYDHDEFLVKTKFWQDNGHAIVHSNGTLRKGCGWKPYIILNALSQVRHGDVVFYTDCGCSFRRGLGDVLRSHFAKENTLLLDSVFVNRFWTKHDCFYLMNCNGEKYKNTMQLMLAAGGFKNNPATIKVLQEWLHYCSNKDIVSRCPSKLGKDDPCFMEHRGDQSILTNLKAKYDLPTCSVGHKIWNFLKCHANEIISTDKIKEVGHPAYGFGGNEW